MPPVRDGVPSSRPDLTGSTVLPLPVGAGVAEGLVVLVVLRGVAVLPGVLDGAPYLPPFSNPVPPASEPGATLLKRSDFEPGRLANISEPEPTGSFTRAVGEYCGRMPPLAPELLPKAICEPEPEVPPVLVL